MLQRILTRFFAGVGLVTCAGLATYAGVYLRHLQLPTPTSVFMETPSSSASSTTATPTTTASGTPYGTWSDDPADIVNPQSSVTIANGTVNGVTFITVQGGTAGSRRSDRRLCVGDFVKQYNAAAGLNGTFFANASLEGTDNGLIGPSLCGDEPAVTIGPYDQRTELAGRPLVLMSAGRIKIVDYNPATMDDEASLRALLPSVSDIFLGGVWLVHNGAAADRARLATYHVHDANDFRRRAFFCVMADGRPALGATTCSVSSRQLSAALSGYGIREAVLLDSGFSTSLVCGDHVLVTGHTAPGIPSRPVPHSILLFGNVETAAGSATGGPAPAV